MKQVDTTRRKPFTTISVRPAGKAKYLRFSKRRAITVAKTAEVAIQALESLPREQQERLIEGKPLELTPAPVTQ